MHHFLNIYFFNLNDFPHNTEIYRLDETWKKCVKYRMKHSLTLCCNTPFVVSSPGKNEILNYETQQTIGYEFE